MIFTVIDISKYAKIKTEENKFSLDQIEQIRNFFQHEEDIDIHCLTIASQNSL